MAILSNHLVKHRHYDSRMDGVSFVFCDRSASPTQKRALVVAYQVVCVGCSRLILILGKPTMS